MKRLFLSSYVCKFPAVPRRQDAHKAGPETTSKLTIDPSIEELAVKKTFRSISISWRSNTYTVSILFRSSQRQEVPNLTMRSASIVEAVLWSAQHSFLVLFSQLINCKEELGCRLITGQVNKLLACFVCHVDDWVRKLQHDFCLLLVNDQLCDFFQIHLIYSLIEVNVW